MADRRRRRAARGPESHRDALAPRLARGAHRRAFARAHPGRAHRLAQLVELQADTGSQLARSTVAATLALLQGAEPLGRMERELLDLLRNWDRASRADSRAAAAYHVLCARTLPQLLRPALGGALADAYLALPRVSASALLADALARAAAGGDEDAPWTDPALAREALLRSLRETSLFLAARIEANREKWTWGRLHGVRFAPLWPGAWQGEAAALGPYPIGGDADAIAVSEYAPLGESFDAAVVPSYPAARGRGKSRPSAELSCPASPSTRAMRTPPTASRAGRPASRACSRRATPSSRTAWCVCSSSSPRADAALRRGAGLLRGVRARGRPSARRAAGDRRRRPAQARHGAGCDRRRSRARRRVRHADARGPRALSAGARAGDEHAPLPRRERAAAHPSSGARPIASSRPARRPRTSM